MSFNVNRKLFTICLESSKYINILPKSLPVLTGSKINMMGGLFKAPVQAQSRYVFVVSTFENTRLLHQQKCSGISPEQMATSTSQKHADS